ncbi:MAG: radical SAM protein [Kiritimatiellia bacterium]
MILLITPPFVQLNTPYSATPILSGFLRSRGADVSQVDLSLKLALHLFSNEGLIEIAEECRKKPEKTATVQFFLDKLESYTSTVDEVISFLQGRNDAAGWLIARPGWLPEGPSFNALEPEGTGITADENLAELFGDLGVADRAKYLASLYLDDIALIIREGADQDFGFSRYAERIAASAPSFSPLQQKLEGETTYIDRLIETMTAETLKKHSPDIAGITIPFPGTLYSALRICKTIRRCNPDIRIVIGGGYVNTELRNLTDRRIFEYVDAILYDEGFEPWLGITGEADSVRTVTRESELPPDLTASPGGKAHLKPDYDGLNLTEYFSLMEMPNPMHRIWSDGRWLKLQLSNGCYWNKCAFCDTSLDYIRRYQPPDINELIDCIIRLKKETGQSGFHFTDEALPPALIRKFCKEIVNRSVVITWWGNIRFESNFDSTLAQLMADSGCIAVTGGLECADNRLLQLMNKGITLESATKACKALADAGILVHAYLMYGFPTQTRKETVEALDFVRRCFASGCIQSAYWHRFALTTHSPIAKEPEKYGIELIESEHKEALFAINEIAYREPAAPDHDKLGKSLRHALYNYMLGLGLDIPAKEWF